MAATRRSVLAAALAASLAPPHARAQDPWPAKPITLIVPFAPGGIADITARLVAQAMGESLKQTVIVDNRPSAGSIVATSAVVNAPADGHTLLLMSNANAVSASLFKKLPFDVAKDLRPVSTLGFFDLAVCVGAHSRFQTLRELVQDAKVRPGKLTIGSIAAGSTQHLAAELFKTVAAIDATVVPYKGSPAVLGALRTGEIDVAFEILGPTLPQIAAGTVRALAVASEQRNPAAPQVPTAAEGGVAHYHVASWNALAAPAATPVAIVARLQRAAQEALAQPALRQRLVELGVRPQAGTPAELQSLLATETKRWREVIVAAKIEPQ